MPDEKPVRVATRYDTVIATLVGFLALLVSGYTAYVQRQQMRAAVWPMLEYDTGNAPDIHFTVANKGVGPAVVKHVIVRVDNETVRNWKELLGKLLGPGEHHAHESDLTGHLFSPGESITILAPADNDGKTIAWDRSNPLWVKLDAARARVTIEICYCSTLGECWTLHAGEGKRSVTTDTKRPPLPSAISFEQ